ncbi:MAG: hypothetical protein JWO98_717 [Frankiales bacterium]|nr:hypothetical protein [Frankiales bacterium]
MTTMAAEAAGSPPRARGALGRSFLGTDRLGLTPAGAGSTTTTAETGCSTRAHPRGRGEHYTLTADVPDDQGSPPRARGAQVPFGRLDVLPGLTPAGAGSTLHNFKPDRSNRAHPRGRGEHNLHRPGVDGHAGSPPRARGALPAPAPRVRPRGLTPAGAGSTSRPSSPTASTRAHPRGRGEHRRWWPLWPPRPGSPPRARGALRRPQQGLAEPGLTPAGAGSTRRKAVGERGNWAHPRGRGEHASPMAVTNWEAGSPPRARGAPPQAGPADVGAGLTPAGAGSTGYMTEAATAIRAHPRGRGEHGGGLSSSSTLPGSPPRAQGAPE